MCLQAISRYGIANLIPLGGRVSFTELAKQTGLGDQMITRLLRHAMTMRIFCEPEPGQVAHTKASKSIASSHMNAWLRIGTHEMWPAATNVRWILIPIDCLASCNSHHVRTHRCWMPWRNGQGPRSPMKRYDFPGRIPSRLVKYIKLFCLTSA